MKIGNPKEIRKFNQIVDHFIILDDPFDRIGVLFEFRFNNGLGVSVADHSGVDHNDTDFVSVAVINPDTDSIISESESIDSLLGLLSGVTLLHRSEVPDFLEKVKKVNLLELVWRKLKK